MDEQIQSTLQERFGFSEFRPGQFDVIRNLVNGASSAAVFPTGGGKSLCYQLPALLLPGMTLVVSPLIALMKDQIDALHARGISAARMDSTLSLDEYRTVARQMRHGELKLLYVAPERFANERFRGLLSQVNVSLFAVDEAHCISEWGHNFRPDYLKLARFAQECRADAVLALTATATPQVMTDMCRFFDIADACAVRMPFYRSNLTLLSQAVEESERDAALLSRLQTRPAGPTIVYVTLQRTAEEVASRLSRHGLPARAYHAGMDDDVRAEVQDWFMASDSAVVVATIAFGMGIDKSNIRYVYHYNMPKSLENYSQEIGRAGRDGQPAICEMLFCPDDLNVLENFILGDTPDRDSVAGLVRTMLLEGDEIAISQYSESGLHDIRPLVMRTLITYLELDGWIEETTPVYSTYQFIPHQTSKEILANFDAERQAFLSSVFGQVTKAKKWCSIDVDAAARRIGSDRGRIVRAFDYLAEQGQIELKVTGLTHRYRRLKSLDHPDALTTDDLALTDDLCERMRRREQRDLGRLAEIVDFATGDGCQVSRLGAYFGEPLESGCGHCSRCLDESPGRTVERVHPEIDEAIWQRALHVRASHSTALNTSQRFAKFLCGLNSPRLTKAKLNRDELFGVFEKIPFQLVRDRAEQEPLTKPVEPPF